MSMDTSNQRLAEWLQLLGCPVQLTPEDFQRLNTPSMRSVWRNFQSHVMSVQNVQTIRKNLLLSKLKKQHILPGTFGSFKIESVQELSKLQNFSDTQDEVNNLKDELKSLDKILQTASCTFLTKIAEKECMKHNIKEIEDKTKLLKMKLFCIQKDIDILEQEIESASCLKIAQAPVSYKDLNNKKSIVAKYVLKHKYSTKDNDYMSEMIMSTIEFPASTIFDGILLASTQALKSLNCCKNNLESSVDMPRLKEKSTIKEDFIVSKHLDKLNSLVFQNEIQLCRCLDKVRENSEELKKEGVVLTKAIEEIYFDNRNDTYDNRSVEEYVNTVVKNTVRLKKMQKLRTLKEEMELSSEDFEHLKWIVNSLGEKENTLCKELDKKVNDVNKLFTVLCNSQVTAVKAEVFQKCSEQVYQFLTKFKLTCNENVNIFIDSQDIIGKEIEMFQKAPLDAILRKWENTCELLPYELVQNIPKNPSLLCFLLESPPKNIFKSLLEKKCWSQTIDQH